MEILPVPTPDAAAKQAAEFFLFARVDAYSDNLYTTEKVYLFFFEGVFIGTVLVITG